MQQREFTANKTIYLSDDDFYVRPADICIHTEPTNKLAIYRNQEVAGVFPRSLTSVLSMVNAGWLTETAANIVAEEAPAIVLVANPLSVSQTAHIEETVEPTPEPVFTHADVTATIIQPEVEEVEAAPVVEAEVEAVVEPVAVVEAAPVAEEVTAKVEEPKAAKKGNKR